MRVLNDMSQMGKSGLIELTTIFVVAILIRYMLPAALESFLVVSKPLSKADALVVMAGGHKVRLPPVAKLYEEGVALRVLLTNDGIFASWSQRYQRNLYLVEWAREDLVKMGVPGGAIVLLDHTASGTIHDALNALAYVRTHPEIRNLLVVTSDYHTRRTLWAFKRVFEGEGVQIGVYPVPDLSETWWRRTCVIYLEFLKYVYYRVAY